MEIKTGYQHIMLSDTGVPIIAGTTMKVVELVLDHLAYGWSPEELHLQHPYLTLGQIHSALAYYWDHKAQMEQEIAHGLRRVDDLQGILTTSNLRERLQAKGLL